jgi:hypothetical protein
MKKLKITYILAVCLLCLSIFVVYAAFMFNQTITTTGQVGNVRILNKSFISYAPTVDVSDTTTYPGGKADQAYLNAIKQRAATGTEFEQASVTCYASEKEGYNEELIPTSTGNKNFFYLNQLGFKIEFTTDIDVYIRIHFSDAWIKTKTYNGNTQDPEYVLRDQFDLEASDNKWRYDEATNTQNYTEIIKASPNTTQSFEFNIANDYFYTDNEVLGNGHKSIMVQVSFTVDIIQANRAYKLWGYDPTDTE